MTIGQFAKLGFDSVLNVSEESTFGTVNSTPAESIKFNSMGMVTNYDEILLPTINTTRNYIDRFRGNKMVEGTLEFPLHDTDGILFLKHAFGGTATVAVISAGVSFEHTFTPGDSLVFDKVASTETSLSILMRKGDAHYYEYMGCRVNNYTVSGNVNEAIMCSVDLIGRDSTNGATTAGAVAFSTGIPFTFKDAKFYVADSIGTLTITAGEEFIQSFELSVGNNIASDESVRGLGTNTVSDLPPAALRDVTLNITQRMDTTTAFNLFNDGTARAVLIVLNTGVTITGADSTTYSLRFELPKVYYNSAEAPIDGPGVISRDITLRAVADSITGFDIRAVLNNGVATY